MHQIFWISFRQKILTVNDQSYSPRIHILIIHRSDQEISDAHVCFLVTPLPLELKTDAVNKYRGDANDRNSI